MYSYDFRVTGYSYRLHSGKALISAFPQVGQGEGHSAVMGATLRRLGGRNPA